MTGSLAHMHCDFTFAAAPTLEAAAAARRAVDLGFDGFFTAETSHDPFLPLVLAAREAPVLTLGTAIAVAFPRSPMVVAQTSRDLHDATDGKFILGLGTQIKPHIERRFSTPWSAPVPRLREYIEALRAIWRAFEGEEPLRFAGDHYQFSLLTPFFSPGPTRNGPIRVAIAGVGPGLSRLAGDVCDGFHIHPFHTVRYIDDVVLPNIAVGAERSGRTLDDVDRIVNVFVVTGHSDREISAMRETVKSQVAFYASTPSYRIILDTHGWDFGDELNRMSRQGRWAEMAALIPDEVVDEVAVVAPPEELGRRIQERYGDRIQRVGLYNLAPGGAVGDEELASIVAAIRG